jgi:hypothetical protein
MLSTAAAPATKPALVELICDKVYSLTQANWRGYPIGIEAMTILARRAPARQADALQKKYLLQQKVYTRSEGPDKIDAGQAIIDTLLELSDIKANEGDAESAGMYLRRAISIASASESDTKDYLQARLKGLGRRIAIFRKARQLAETIKNDPNNIKNRRELVLLYIVQLDDPQAAASLLRADLDEALRSYVPLAGRNPATLPAEVLNEMVEWYWQLIDSAPASARGPLLLRTHQYLNLFLARYPRQDPQRTRAVLLLRKINRDMEELGITAPVRHWATNVAALGLISTPQVNRAISLAGNYLLSMQNGDGSWPMDPTARDSYPSQHATALSAYALIRSGVSAKDPRITKALQWLADKETVFTATLAWRCRLWGACRDELGGKYDRQLHDNAMKLIKSTADGSFLPRVDPQNPTRKGNNEYTQLAVLSVAAAADAGVKIPRSFWNRVILWYQKCQNSDGGWGQWPGHSSQHFYTAGGLASLLICMDHLGAKQPAAVRIRYVQRAADWIDKRFNDGKNTNPLKFLFQLARVGVARGTQQFGGVSWYPWACKDIINHQSKKGQWSPRGKSPVLSTALGILMLDHARMGR